MTSLRLTGSSAPQLDAHLYGIRNEFDRLNQELDEARKQREEYKSLYKNQEKELRRLIALLFHRLNGKDQICQCCKGEITHTAALADDNPSSSPASPSSEYYSPLEEKDIVPALLDNTASSIEISLVDGDVRLGEETISVGNEDSTSSPPLGSDLISAEEVGKSMAWDIEYNDNTAIALKLDLVHELKQEGNTCVAFSPNGKYLATASSVGIVCIFDVSTGERISVMRDLYRKPDERDSYSCLGFSPDNNYLATGGDGTVTIWIISQRRVRNIFRLGDNIYDLGFSPNGKHLISCSDETVTLWRLRDGLSRVLTGGQPGYTPWVVRFSPDGAYIVSGYNPRKILIWNVRSGGLVARWEGHDGPVSRLEFTPDGNGLVTASWDTTVVGWDVGVAIDNAEGEHDVKESTMTEISRFVGHNKEVEALSISPDGKWIVSGSFDKTVRIWDAHNATSQCTLRGPDKVWSVAFSPVGTYLAIGGDFPQVTIWNYAGLR